MRDEITDEFYLTWQEFCIVIGLIILIISCVYGVLKFFGVL
jgi:hypothetical protein